MSRYDYRKKKVSLIIFSALLILCGISIFCGTSFKTEKKIPATTRTWWSRFSWTWTIGDWKTSDLRNGYGMNSSSFSIRGQPHLTWFVSFYPYGEQDNTKDFVGLFLHYVSDVGDGKSKGVYIRCSLSIDDSRGRVLNEVSFSRRFSKTSNRYGYERFLQTKHLLNAINDSIVNIHLDISTKYEGTEDQYIAQKDTCFTRNQFMEDFSSFRRKRSLHDICLISSDDQRFSAHKAILAARSSFFFTKFKENEALSTITLDYNSYTVEKLLDFLYGGKVNLWYSVKDNMNLLKAAREYNLKHLLETSAHCLTAEIDLKNAADILLLADEVSVKELKDNAIDFIQKNVEAFLHTYLDRDDDSRTKKRLSQLLGRIKEL